MRGTEPGDRQAPAAHYLLHRVHVARRRRLSPGFVRVTFAGATLDRFADPGLDQRIKLLLPAADGTLDALPFEGDWFRAWRALPEATRPVMRTYTTRAVRPEAREVDVDFVVHEPCGPAGRFAADCAAGDPAVLYGPNRDSDGSAGGIDFRLPAGARRVLVAGDETALPAVARILDGLPAGVRATALLEVPYAEDARDLPRPAGVDLRMLVRADRPHGALLAPAVRAAAEALGGTRIGSEPEDVDVDAEMLWEVPDDGSPAADDAVYAWLAGEAGVIKALRRTLVAELGVDRRAVAFMGYWRAGRAEGA